MMRYNRDGDPEDDEMEDLDDEELEDEEDGDDDESVDRSSLLRAQVNPFTSTSGTTYRPPSATPPASGGPPRGGSPADRYNSSRLPGSPGGGGPPSMARPPGSGYGSGSRPGSTYPSSGGGSGYGASSASGPSPTSPTYSRPTSPTSRDPEPPKPEAKKDNKPASEGAAAAARNALGGLTKNLPFGKGDGKKDSKPAGEGAAAAARNALGGLTKNLPFGKGDGKKDNKPATPKAPGGGMSAALGGLSARLPFGKGDGQKDSKPAAPSSAGGGAPRTAPFSGAGRPATPPPAGGAAKAPAGPKVSLAERLMGVLGKRDGSKKPPSVREKAARATKTPRVEGEGLTLDNKLDILGVVLLLSALALFFSSLSPTQGQLTGAVNTALSQLLGQGALAVPGVMFAIGLWLVVRHFGDEAPVIDPVRIGGVGVIYIGVLLLFQFIESFNPEYANINPADSSQLQLLLELSWRRGLGGGWFGAQLYYLLVANITEPGMFVVMIGLLMVGAMLLLRLTAAEIAIFFISIGRSFVDARRRRVQQRQAAARLAAAQSPPALAVNVSKPAVAELEAGTASPPALPAAGPRPDDVPAEEPRPIPITMGGRTVTAFFGGDGAPAESAPVERAAGSSAPAEEKTGLGARLRGALPAVALPGLPSGRGKGSESESGVDNGDKSAEKSGGLAGRLFSRAAPAAKPAEPVTDKPDQPATPPPTPAFTTETGRPVESAPPTPPPAAPVTASVQAAPAADSPPRSSYADRFRRPDPAGETPSPAVTPEAPAAKPAEEPPARLGDLMRPAPRPAQPIVDEADDEADDIEDEVIEAKPATPRGITRTPTVETARPFSASAPRTPVDEADDADDEDDEDESLRNLPPAQPRAASPWARSEAASTPESKPTGPSTPAPASTPPTPSGSPPGSLAERRSRLDELRQGIAARQQGQEGTPPALAPIESAPPAPAPQQAAPEPKPIPPAPTPAQPEPARPAPAIRETPPVTPPAQPAFRRPDGPPAAPVSSRARRTYRLPDYRALLNIGSESDFNRETLLQRARIIEDTLSSFGAPGRVVEVNTGPVITQYGVEPDYLVSRSGKKSRVKVGAIAQLDKDLQLALGAKSIRIEAPVPGKGYVGIEVPNDESSIVSLRDVMESDGFRKIRAKSPLAIALGQSVDGTPISADLASMPHLLVAGTTGSGKSVLVNAIITCLALNNTPEQVKFIMVDPKRVELTGYNGIPHLVAPVVVELERIVGVLKWVTREMDERYKQFSSAGARNIEDFNRHLSADAEPMPYIVVIIDELADLMMLAPDETERVITRIAALARATGIHLVIATQRPSVDVVTGLIKANFPARIAFAVAGGVDSRVILDQPGAERLLGKGDMLYLSGNSPAPLRLQGVFVSDPEINNITRFWKTQLPDGGPSRPITALVVDDDIKEQPRDVTVRGGQAAQQAFWDRSSSVGVLGHDDDDDDGGDQEDALYEEAVEMVRNLKKASVSLLQRRLRIGYTRAARLIDLMEERGIVGPAQEGSKPREVLKFRD